MGGNSEFIPMSDSDLENVFSNIEHESSAAIENGVKRRRTPNRMGQRLHQPLPTHQEKAQQYYYDYQGNLIRANVHYHKTHKNLSLHEREEQHQEIASLMARQLERVREQASKRVRRQTQGKLDRRQLVNAYKGLDDVRLQTKNEDRTSFAVSVAVDQSGSMSNHIENKNLYDAAMVLARTFEQMDMAYEMRGFGSTNAQYKAMNDKHFDRHRAASLAHLTLGGTYLRDTTGLAAQSLLAREESNRLYVSLTDGDLYDHKDTVAEMANARKQGIITYGIYLGKDVNVSRMDEIYGRGNWTSIQELSDMPKKVGQRIASIFRAMR